MNFPVLLVFSKLRKFNQQNNEQRINTSNEKITKKKKPQADHPVCKCHQALVQTELSLGKKKVLMLL